MLSSTTSRLFGLMFIALYAAVIWFVPVFANQDSCECLTVSFLNVGQGDAIYIETSDGFEVLVDGGRDSAVLAELSKNRSFFDRKLDLVVATHPDLDHIGGLVSILNRFKVEAVLITENQNDTPAAAAFSQAVASESAAVIYADAGQRFQLGVSTTMTVFSPNGDEADWQPNNASIILKVSYGETDILLTGDAPAEIENYLVDAYGTELQSEILKLGHHGSKTSTSDLFLDTVKPDYAIVSAGIDNSYGHPHQDVIGRVFARNIPTFHTGTNGTITFVSDGNTISQE